MNAGGHGSDMAACAGRGRRRRPAQRRRDRRRCAAGVARPALPGLRPRPTDEVVLDGRAAARAGRPGRVRGEISRDRALAAGAPAGRPERRLGVRQPGARRASARGARSTSSACAACASAAPQVSDKHANFIQADEGGSADDVRRRDRGGARPRRRGDRASCCAARSAWSASTTVDVGMPTARRVAELPERRKPPAHAEPLPDGARRAPRGVRPPTTVGTTARARSTSTLRQVDDCWRPTERRRSARSTSTGRSTRRRRRPEHRAEAGSTPDRDRERPPPATAADRPRVARLRIDASTSRADAAYLAAGDRSHRRRRPPDAASPRRARRRDRRRPRHARTVVTIDVQDDLEEIETTPSIAARSSCRAGRSTRGCARGASPSAGPRAASGCDGPSSAERSPPCVIAAGLRPRLVACSPSTTSTVSGAVYTDPGRLQAVVDELDGTTRARSSTRQGRAAARRRSPGSRPPGSSAELPRRVRRSRSASGSPVATYQGADRQLPRDRRRRPGARRARPARSKPVDLLDSRGPTPARPRRRASSSRPTSSPRGQHRRSPCPPSSGRRPCSVAVGDGRSAHHDRCATAPSIDLGSPDRLRDKLVTTHRSSSTPEPTMWPVRRPQRGRSRASGLDPEVNMREQSHPQPQRDMTVDLKSG